jgi:enamine deaminase RidA (YjgF/YER057c/UK114 family)
MRPAINDPDARLAALGLALPKPPPAIASVLPWWRSGETIYISGQIATSDGRLLHEGRVGETVGLEQAQECARACALNALSQLDAATGDLDRIEQLVKLTVFVASAPEFAEQHLVANGASDLLIDVFGEPGRHARSAIGVAALPLASPVEIELIAQARE